MGIEGHFGPSKQTFGKGRGRELVKGEKAAVLSGNSTPGRQKIEQLGAEALPLHIFGIDLFSRQKQSSRQPEGEYYAGVEAYDPVLLWHCGLVAPETKKPGQAPVKKTEPKAE